MNIFSPAIILAFKELILAALLGAFIGLEREWAQKEAGLRTFTIISTGSALFIILARLYYSSMIGTSSLDPSRVLGQIVVAIGFLGAGTIIFQRREGRVKGLTTAAMMWITSAIGAAVGLQFYQIAIFTTFLIVGLSFLMIPLEKRLESKIEQIKEKEEK